MFDAWMARLLDRTEDEAMSYKREAHMRYYKAFQFAGYTLAVKLIEQFWILQVSRPNWILVLSMYVGAVVGQFVAIAFMERAKENQSDTLSDLKNNIAKAMSNDASFRHHIRLLLRRDGDFDEVNENINAKKIMKGGEIKSN